MSNTDEEKVKALAEIKEYLERRVSELTREIETLRKLIQFVDEELAARSFKKPKIVEKPPPRVEPGVGGRIRVLKSRSGENLATVTVTSNEIRFIINPNITVTSDMRPFSSFLIRKVLDAMSRADAERVEKGTLPPGHELSYEVILDGDRVKEIIVRNFREEHRLREIINAVRWTLETISSASVTRQ